MGAVVYLLCYRRVIEFVRELRGGSWEWFYFVYTRKGCDIEGERVSGVGVVFESA